MAKSQQADGKGKASAPGQAKLHDYTRTVDGVDEAGSFPQSEHKSRKAEGWERVDDADGADDEEADVNPVDPAAGGTGGAQGQG